jgi:hypothetical protein
MSVDRAATAFRVVGLAGACVALVLLLLTVAPRAYANHIAGATYTGTHAGGGTVEFDVSSDGANITRFKVTNIRGNICTVSQQEVTYSPGFGVPITNHAFSGKSGSGQLSFSGSFPGTQSAQGTFAFDSGFGPGPRCRSDTVAWTTTTTAQPPDTTAPVLLLGGRTTQHPVSQRGVLVVARCPSEACTATATGTVSVPSSSRVFRLRSVTKQIARGGSASIKLRFTRTAFNAVKRALNGGARLKARIAVTARDAAGNSTRKTRTITLRR